MPRRKPRHLSSWTPLVASYAGISDSPRLLSLTANVTTARVLLCNAKLIVPSRSIDPSGERPSYGGGRKDLRPVLARCRAGGWTWICSLRAGPRKPRLDSRLSPVRLCRSDRRGRRRSGRRNRGCPASEAGLVKWPFGPLSVPRGVGRHHQLRWTLIPGNAWLRRLSSASLSRRSVTYSRRSFGIRFRQSSPTGPTAIP